MITVGLMLAQRRGRWINVKPTVIQRLVYAVVFLLDKLLLTSIRVFEYYEYEYEYFCFTHFKVVDRGRRRRNIKWVKN